jgi:hypothetical protein
MCSLCVMLTLLCWTYDDGYLWSPRAGATTNLIAEGGGLDQISLVSPFISDLEEELRSGVRLIDGMRS